MSDGPAVVVQFVDVGQGDATIVFPPDGAPIVFDCGASGHEVVNQLRFNGVDRLRAVIASHLDLDHIGGMATVLDAFRGRIDTVYFAPDRDISPDTEEAKTAKELADSIYEGDGESWDLVWVQRQAAPVAYGEGWSVRLLAPRAKNQQRTHRTGEWEDPNRYSAVLRVEHAGNVALIGGDAPLATWAETPEEELVAQVFRTPHHGGALTDGGVPKGWSAERLYKVVEPETAVVSVGTNNDHGHPEIETWTKPLVGRVGCDLLCTQVTGRCHPPFARQDDPLPLFDNRKERLAAIQQARERWVPDRHGGSFHFAEPPWRHYSVRKSGQLGTSRKDRPEVPCAGTVSVRLGADGSVRIDPDPESAELDARIRQWREPLCRR